MIEWQHLTIWLEDHTTFIYVLTALGIVWLIRHFGRTS